METEMFPFAMKSGKVGDTSAQDEVVWRLLDAPSDERPVLLMTALQSGELRLSEAPEVLATVNRIESLSRPIRPIDPAEAAGAKTAAGPAPERPVEYIGATEPYWRQDGHRYIF